MQKNILFRILLILLILLSLLFLISCKTDVGKNSIFINQSTFDNATAKEEYEIHKFKYFTKDGFEIYGNLYLPLRNKQKNINPKNVLLIHGWGQNQDIYNNFVNYLLDNNITVITIDLRGHGKSTYKKGVEIYPQDLTLEDYSLISDDINGVVEYLLLKDVNPVFSIVGSDIGANIGLNFASENDEVVEKLILVSPSLNYYGITAKEQIQNYNKSLLFITSVSDSISYEASKLLHELSNSTKKEIKLYSGSDHGTSLFIKEMGLMDYILNWIIR
jgi:pimeloyl-ACP methyl ester carboxylesterase